MGINFDGVNPESKAKLEGIVSDGKVTASEVKGLTEAEKEALSKALGGKPLPDTGEIKVGEPNMPKEEGRSVGEAIGIGAAVIAGTAVLGGIIGGIVGFFGGAGVGAVPAAAAGAKLGAIAGAALVGASALTSCEKGPDVVVEGDEYDINNPISVSITNVTDPTLKQAIMNLQESVDNMTEMQKAGNDHLKTIIALITTLSGRVANIEKQGDAHTKLLTDIYNQLNKLTTSSNENSGKILSYLQKISSQLESMSKDQAEAHQAILAKLDTINQNFAKLSVENKNLFNKVLAKLDDLGYKEDPGYLDILNKILDKITESTEQNQEMDATTHELLNTIIEKEDGIKASVDGLNNAMQVGITAILDKLGQMSEDDKKAVAAILAKLDKMDDNVKNGFGNVLKLVAEGNKISSKILAKLSVAVDELGTMNETNKAGFNAVLNAIQNIGDINANPNLEEALAAILDAINKNTAVTSAQLEELRKLIVENNKIAQGTQDAVNALKGSMEEQHKAILDKLGKGNASLVEIKSLLEGIKTGVGNNTALLTDINDKLNFAGTVLNNILANVTNIKDETKALLLQILAKIPNGCTCTAPDLSAIIDLLNKIVEELQKDPQDTNNDQSHEGVLNDLDKYFQ